MLRKPAFWLVFALVSVLAVAAARLQFSSAFPLVSIDLRMDRGEALQRARALAAEHRLGPPAFRQAATFGGDEEVQTYVELEAGGKDAFARMIRDGRYAPSAWRVRHFREHDPNETWIRFAPAGVPIGFVERLPETAPGARLPAADARAIAERAALAWHVALPGVRARRAGAGGQTRPPRRPHVRVPTPPSHRRWALPCAPGRRGRSLRRGDAVRPGTGGVRAAVPADAVRERGDRLRIRHRDARALRPRRHRHRPLRPAAPAVGSLASGAGVGHCRRGLAGSCDPE